MTATRSEQLARALAHHEGIDTDIAVALLAGDDDLFVNDQLVTDLVDDAVIRIVAAHPRVSTRRLDNAFDHAYEAAARRAGLRDTAGADGQDPVEAAYEAAARRAGLRA